MIVGGAQRNNRNRKQRQNRQSQNRSAQNRPKQATAAARSVAAARGGKRDLTKSIAGAVVIVVIAAAVVGGVLYEKHKSEAAAQTVIPALTVAGSAQVPVTIDKTAATVLVGKPDAKVTVNAYEDFECPICRDFESANFPEIEKQLQAGTVKVNYHMINLLDASSVPAGYSSMSANTALAVATVAPEKFMDFHYSLYQKQPEENGPGWTQAQLTSLANRLGVTGSEFTSLINNKTYFKQIQANLDNASKNKALFQTSSDGSTGFGTPTIVANNKVVNWQNDTTWLSDLVKSAYPSS
ncbi:MAG TPA: thioredoxin domain-containing protein [Pseudonocardiaceae bacterium]|nr:thioredoxin domain-containing protein [Pseudonocardiaceae bacterium]